jgi:hypothetical protein
MTATEPIDHVAIATRSGGETDFATAFGSHHHEALVGPTVSLEISSWEYAGKGEIICVFSTKHMKTRLEKKCGNCNK